MKVKELWLAEGAGFTPDLLAGGFDSGSLK